MSANSSLASRSVSYVLAGPGEKKRMVASLPCAMRPRIGCQLLGGQALLLEWGQSRMASSMTLGKGGKEPSASFIRSPVLAATMACGGNLPVSRDYTYTAKLKGQCSGSGGCLTVPFSFQPTPSACWQPTGSVSECIQAPQMTASKKGTCFGAGRARNLGHRRA